LLGNQICRQVFSQAVRNVVSVLVCCIHRRNDSDRTYLSCPIRAWIRFRSLGVREW